LNRNIDLKTSKYGIEVTNFDQLESFCQIIRKRQISWSHQTAFLAYPVNVIRRITNIIFQGSLVEVKLIFASMDVFAAYNSWVLEKVRCLEAIRRRSL